MKSVLISIQPKWCELIAAGEKTVEVRKTKPKLETPFKVYIYCTKGKFEPSEYLRNNLHYDDSTIRVCEGQGKVIGEFVCDCMTSLKADNMIQAYYNNTKETCLTDEEIKQYANNGKLFYWHISDLVIYDKPRELSEFKKPCICKDEYEGEEYCDCLNCDLAGDSDYGIIACDRKITRPPQSWCYVEGSEI